jgi:hypothetical protein
MTPAERADARRRFEQDQADAQFVEYAEAMERVDSRWRWRRRRERFLRLRGYPVA